MNAIKKSTHSTQAWLVWVKTDVFRKKEKKKKAQTHTHNVWPYRFKVNNWSEKETHAQLIFDERLSLVAVVVVVVVLYSYFKTQ